MNTTRVTSIAAALALLLFAGARTAVAEELVPQFERSTKHKVAITYDLAATIKKQIESGEPFDVAFLTPGVIDDLIAAKKLAADSRAVIAQSGLAIASRA